jgi:hypothetical protein
MTTQYAGLDLWSETIDHVTDDDTRDASSYAISAIGLADRTQYLKNRGFYSTPAFGTDPYTNAGTYRVNGQIIFTNTSGIGVRYATARIYKRTATPATNAKSTYWDDGTLESGPQGWYKQKTIAVAAADELLVFDFNLPSNCTITGISVYVEPVNTHLALPTKPKFESYLADNQTGVTSILVTGGGVDPSVNFTQYNLPHSVSTATMSTAFNAGKHRLFIKFFGETGGDAVIGLKVFLPVITFTREQIGEEFGELVP